MDNDSLSGEDENKPAWQKKAQNDITDNFTLAIMPRAVYYSKPYKKQGMVEVKECVIDERGSYD